MLTIKSLVSPDRSGSTGLQEPPEAPVKPRRMHRRVWESETCPFTDVLAYTEPGQAQTDVIAWAFQMARANAARLKVVQFTPRAGEAATGGPGENVRFAEFRSSLKSLESALRAAREQDHPVHELAEPAIEVRTEAGEAGPAVASDLEASSTCLVVLDADSLVVPTNRCLAVLRQGLWRPAACFLLVRPSIIRRLREIAVCSDPSPSAGSAIRHASRLSESYGSAVRIVHPYHLSSLEMAYKAESLDFDPALDAVAQQKVAEKFASHLPAGLLDFDTVDVAYREVSNWDYASRLVSLASHEQTDLLILPISRYVMFEALRQKELIRRIAAASRSSVLVVRA